MMNRLIDADALKLEFTGITPFAFDIGKVIDAAPTVAAVRGKWRMDEDPDDGDCRCTNCNVCIDALHRRNHKLLNILGYKLHTFYPYCPNCGAKMEEDT